MKTKSFAVLVAVGLLADARYHSTTPPTPAAAGAAGAAPCRRLRLVRRKMTTRMRRAESSDHIPRRGNVGSAQRRGRTTGAREGLRPRGRSRSRRWTGCGRWFTVERHSEDVDTKQILTEPDQLGKLIRSYSEGTSVTLTVLRKGAETADRETRASAKSGSAADERMGDANGGAERGPAISDRSSSRT